MAVIDKIMQTKLVEVISLVSLIAFVYWNIFNFKSNLKKAPKTMLGPLGLFYQF
jgi:uncharacterized membrane protein YwzB